MNILSIQYGNLENPYSHGGLATLLHQTFKRMVPKHRITCITGLLAGNTNKKEMDGVTYIQAGFGKSKYINRFSFAIKQNLLKIKGEYDLILTPWDRYAPVLINSTYDCPVVLELNLDFFGIPSKSVVAEPVSRYCLKHKLKKSRFIISMSKGVENNLRPYACSAELMEVLHGGVEEDIFRYPITSENEEYLLYLGRLDISHKGIDTLLEAYKASTREIPLILAGDGVDKMAVEKMIQDMNLGESVKMVGWVQGRKKYQLISNCLAVCMPSRVEGWGIIATEAAAMGKPVIGTNVVGLQEAIIHNETGILVERENCQQLVDAIKLLMADKQLRRHLGAQARIRAREFTWEKIAKKKERFFQKVISHHHAARGPY